MSDILIRKMKPDERKAVKKVMKKAFPFLMRFFVYFTKNVVIAEINGLIVGGAILKTFLIDKDRKGGVVCFIFTSPEAKGKGIGQKLTEFGLKFLKDSGCSDIFALVEGDNTSSSKLFSNRGFNLINPVEQIRVYGLKIFHVWINTYHIFDVGHLMWLQREEKIKRKCSYQLLSTLILHTGLFIIMHLRSGSSITYGTTVTIFATFTMLFGLRILSMLIVAKIQKVEVEFRMWESGIVLNFLITVIFGGFVPSPGSLYPKEKNWSYREHSRNLGIMALTSSIILVSILLLLKSFLLLNTLPDFQSYINTAYIITTGIVILDVSLPLFPLSSYNGRRVWNMSRFAWVVLVVPVILQFFI